MNYRNRTIETETARALDLMNAGFTSKAGQKDALGCVNSAYDMAKDRLQRACLDARTPDDGTNSGFKMSDAVNAVYWDVPSYPHQFKAKHCDLIRAAFGDRFDDLVATMNGLVELRDTIKAAPVVAPAKNEAKAIEARIVESIRDRMDRLQVRYLEAIDLCELVGDDCFRMKGLSANSHYVTNEHGTTFLRTFYYLHGKLTPLNLIIAAAQETRRRAEA